MNGKSSIYSYRNVLMANLTFVDGVASGPCTIYDDGYLFFSGYLKNNYREGRGKEYDRNGNLISDGFYSKGKKLNIKPSKEMGKGYWEEYDENDKLIRICQIDNNGIYNGICYLYKDEKIRRISIWKDGKEVTLLKQFSDDIMTEYKNGHVVYEGGFLDSVIYNYPRNGVGEELDEDGKTRIFKGNYKNGKRHGRGSIYKNGMVCNETDWVMDSESMNYGLFSQLLYYLCYCS